MEVQEPSSTNKYTASTSKHLHNMGSRGRLTYTTRLNAKQQQAKRMIKTSTELGVQSTTDATGNLLDDCTLTDGRTLLTFS